MIKKSLTELYSNLPYITLSGARELEFNALSDLTAKISYLLKSATRLNIQEREESHAQNAYNINKNRLFVPKSKIDDEYVKHKKNLHPYVLPQVQTADEIEIETQLVDDDFAHLKAEYDQINDVATEQRKQNKITDLVDEVTDESNPFQNLSTDEIWIEDDLFDQNGQNI